MFHGRQMADRVRQLLTRFPAACLVGPRQCGKTTLAKSLGAHYFDLEHTPDRLRLDAEWSGMMENRELVVFDEAQCWPELFTRLRSEIDADRQRKGRFLLLGSVSLELMKLVSESLAGRLAVAELTPLHAVELPGVELDLLWKFGGFPEGGVLDPDDSFDWHSSYLKLMARRDLPQWGLPAAPAVTERLFRLIAAKQGSIQNASELGAALGLSHHTVQSYLHYLDGVFLIRRLQPYSANLKNRLIRTPKLYWRDSGLLHHLLKLKAGTATTAMPWAGESWEGWVIEQILSFYSSHGIEVEPTFFRDRDGLECDLVLDVQGRRELIEIKLTSHPAPQDLEKLKKIQSLIGADRLVLLTRHRENTTAGATWITNLRGYLHAAEEAS
jgi:predicted AAA+ superfamily ATPase